MSTGSRFGRAGLAVFLVAVVAIIGLMIAFGSDNDDAPDATLAAAPSTSVEPSADQSVSSQADTATEGTTGDVAAATTAPPETPPPTTTTTTVPRPRTTAEATPEDPVPPGEVIEFTGVWDIAITSVELDATEYVVGLNNINPVPEDGYQYVLVSLVGTYLGDRTAQPVFEWTVSDGTNTYEPEIPGCGVIPDSLYDVVEVAPNQSFQGSICIPVISSGVADGLELTLQLVGDDPKYFTLN